MCGEGGGGRGEPRVKRVRDSCMPSRNKCAYSSRLFSFTSELQEAGSIPYLEKANVRPQ